MSGDLHSTCDVLPRRWESLPAVRAALRSIPSSVLSDAMGRRQEHVLHGFTRYGSPGATLCGQAFTVKMPAGDNLVLHAALDVAHEGDVIIVDAGEDVSRAVLGEIVVSYAKRRGIGGFIVSGAVRDTAELASESLQVFALGASPLGPHKVGSGVIGGELRFGSVCISPGDFVVGDDDGVAVIKQHDVENVLSRAREITEAEDAMLRDIDNDLLDRSWVSKTVFLNYL